MKLSQLLEDSLGAQVIAFSKYLQERCPSTKQHKEQLEDFATYLLQHGWKFSSGPSAADFIKGTNADGKFRIVVPEKHWNKGTQNTVFYFYFKEAPSSPDWARPPAASDDVRIHITDLQSMIDALQARMSASVKLPLK